MVAGQLCEHCFTSRGSTPTDGMFHLTPAHQPAHTHSNRHAQHTHPHMHTHVRTHTHTRTCTHTHTHTHTHVICASRATWCTTHTHTCACACTSKGTHASAYADPTPFIFERQSVRAAGRHGRHAAGHRSFAAGSPCSRHCCCHHHSAGRHNQDANQDYKRACAAGAIAGAWGRCRCCVVHVCSHVCVALFKERPVAHRYRCRTQAWAEAISIASRHRCRPTLAERWRKVLVQVHWRLKNVKTCRTGVTVVII